MADKKAIRARMDELLAQGVGKTEVFRQLATTDIKPRVLAGWLAATPDMTFAGPNRKSGEYVFKT